MFNPVPVQKLLPIEDIKEGTIILKNGNIRGVLMASSINFALKSTNEQEAILFKFQSFLNSLDFSIQILITSRKFDLSEYLESLKEQQKTQTNELLKIQTGEYIDFIKSLTELSNIMYESFYIVIPFNQIERRGILSKIKSIFKVKKKKQISELSFQQMRTQLWQRMDFIATALSESGIRCVPLNDQELVELFYTFYNPDSKEKPKLIEQKRIKNEFM